MAALHAEASSCMAQLQRGWARANSSSEFDFWSLRKETLAFQVKTFSYWGAAAARASIPISVDRPAAMVSSYECAKSRVFVSVSVLISCFLAFVSINNSTLLNASSFWSHLTFIWHRIKHFVSLSICPITGAGSVKERASRGVVKPLLRVQNRLPREEQVPAKDSELIRGLLLVITKCCGNRCHHHHRLWPQHKLKASSLSWQKLDKQTDRWVDRLADRLSVDDR